MLSPRSYNLISKSFLISTTKSPLSKSIFIPTTKSVISNPLFAAQTTRPITTTSLRMSTMPTDPSLPGEHFEARQTAKSEDYTPDPKKSLPLSPARQALVDDIIALYGCEPTVKRVERYTPDCVYDDQFVYANDRYKMAGQWFALPKLFNASKNEGYQVVVNEKGLIQFKNAQVRFLSSSPPPQFFPPPRSSLY